jgi:hypothetical protein
MITAELETLSSGTLTLPVHTELEPYIVSTKILQLVTVAAESPPDMAAVLASKRADVIDPVLVR